MFEGELQRKIEEFRELGLPNYVPREGIIHQAEYTISTLIGARRSGKSFRALQTVDEMIQKGILKSLQHVCFIDFDNPILAEMQGSDLSQIPSTFLKLTPDFELNTPIVFILDEVHKINNWEMAVIDLSKNPNWKVIVTGSSSKLMKENIATELRGKAISTTIYPLSFSEFLKFKRAKNSSKSSKGQAETRRYFDEYLKWGAFPAIANLDERSKETLLREYFDTMILKDIVQRFDVSKPKTCIQLYGYLLSAISKPVTFQSAYEYIKTSGLPTSRDAIRDYFNWAEDSWFLFTIPMYSRSHKEKERNYKKVYCIDWGLALQNSRMWDSSYSRALENMVYLHLKRSYPRVNYYLTKSNRQEVDFIASDHHGKPTLAVQVCMDMSQRETFSREVEPLVATAKYFGIKDNFIVTLNQEKNIREGGVSIKIVPAWQWLLEDTKG